MADRTNKQGAGLVSVGVAACAACCAPPFIAFLAAAGVGTLIGVAVFALAGLSVLAAVAVIYLRRRADHHPAPPAATPVPLGRKPDA